MASFSFALICFVIRIPFSSECQRYSVQERLRRRRLSMADWQEVLIRFSGSGWGREWITYTTVRFWGGFKSSVTLLVSIERPNKHGLHLVHLMPIDVYKVSMLRMKGLAYWMRKKREMVSGTDYSEAMADFPNVHSYMSTLYPFLFLFFCLPRFVDVAERVSQNKRDGTIRTPLYTVTAKQPTSQFSFSPFFFSFLLDFLFVWLSTGYYIDASVIIIIIRRARSGFF